MDRKMKIPLMPSATDKDGAYLTGPFLSKGYIVHGIFMVGVDACIQSFERHAPDFTSAANACWHANWRICQRTY